MTCTKPPYTDQATANKSAQRSRQSQGSALHAYKCQDCNAWHIGANNRGKKRPMNIASRRRSFS